MKECSLSDQTNDSARPLTQLCINYANEKLQMQFNSDVLAAAEVEARAEGVSLGSASAHEDNAACVALIDATSPTPGLLPLLHEECALGDGMPHWHRPCPPLHVLWYFSWSSLHTSLANHFDPSPSYLPW